MQCQCREFFLEHWTYVSFAFFLLNRFICDLVLGDKSPIFSRVNNLLKWTKSWLSGIHERRWRISSCHLAFFVALIFTLHTTWPDNSYLHLVSFQKMRVEKSWHFRWTRLTRIIISKNHANITIQYIKIN